MRITLAIITRDDTDGLERAVKSANGLYDELVIVDSSEDLAVQGENQAVGGHFTSPHAPHLKYKAIEWREDFSWARNISWEMASGDWIVWLDTDDEMVNPEEFRGAIERADAAGKNAVVAEYKYEWLGEPGNSELTTCLVRERAVKAGCYEWKGVIHEVLVAKDGEGFLPSGINKSKAWVTHHQVKSDVEEQQRKLFRNLKVFEKHFLEGDKEADARTYFYWGNTLAGVGRPEEAVEKYLSYVDMDPQNLPEIYTAYCSISECSRRAGDPVGAVDAAYQAVRMFPDWPTAWVNAADSHAILGEDEQAISAANRAIEFEPNKAMEMVSNYASIKNRPHLVIASVLSKMDDPEKALAHLNMIDPLYQTDMVEKVRSNLRTAAGRKKAVSAFNEIINGFNAAGRSDSAKAVASLAPKHLWGEPAINREMMIKSASAPSTVAIWCGGIGYEEWDADSALNGGIGGSEEAVINMADRLSRMGYCIEVYGNPTTTLTKPNQVWRHWASYNPSRHVDIFISWRDVGAAGRLRPKSGARYLWMHDMSHPSAWNGMQWENYDKIFFLSEFHRTEHPQVPDEKVFMTANGIDTSILAKIPDEKFGFIWPSCSSRGLVNVLENWDRICEIVGPEHSCLDIYYGFNASYLQAEKRDPVMRRVREMVESGDMGPGIRSHGRVDQIEMNRAMAKAKYWFYPSDFPESFCINAIKAQAHGTIPVFVDRYGLKDTCKHGYSIQIPNGEPISRHMPEMIEAVKKAHNHGMSNHSMEAMINFGRSWTWEKVAESWSSEFILRVPSLLEKQLV